MKEALITFETAKLAKEMGFNVVISYHYDKSGKIQMFTACNEKIDFGYSAPTQSLLQKWLREVQGIDVLVDVEYYLKGRRYICNIFSSKEDLTLDNFNTFEEALEGGLQKALKLIIC